MSDISEVLSVLRDAAVAAVYPNGTSQPSLTGRDVAVYAGWPNDESLSKAIAAGRSHVTVFPKAMERNTTRYSRDAQVIAMPAPTITAAVAGYSVTLTGTISTPQNVALMFNGKAYVHPVQASDSLTSIATALAAAVAADVAGTSSNGPVITVGTAARSLIARVGASGTVAREIKRQERVVAITVWAPNQADRDALAAAIDIALTDANFVTLPDGFAARVQYHNSLSDDALQKSNVYRRDLNYSVEYATTITTTAPAVIVPQADIADAYSATINTRIF